MKGKTLMGMVIFYGFLIVLGVVLWNLGFGRY